MKNSKYLAYGSILVAALLGVVRPWEGFRQESERLAYSFLNGTLVEDQNPFSVEIELGESERVLLENDYAISFVHLIDNLPHGISHDIAGQRRIKVATITVFRDSDKATIDVFQLGSSGVSWCSVRSFDLQVFFSVDVGRIVEEFLTAIDEGGRRKGASHKKKGSVKNATWLRPFIGTQAL